MQSGEVKIRSFNLYNFIGRTIIFLLGAFCAYVWFQDLTVEINNNAPPAITPLLILMSGLTLTLIALMLGGFSEDAAITKEYIVKGRKPDWNE
jgi:hypothetical protein